MASLLPIEPKLKNTVVATYVSSKVGDDKVLNYYYKRYGEIQSIKPHPTVPNSFIIVFRDEESAIRACRKAGALEITFDDGPDTRYKVDTRPFQSSKDQEMTAPQRPSDSLTCQLIQSKKSQYTQGSISGCVVFASEAALLLCYGSPASEALIGQILVTPYRGDHLEIEDALTKINRFRVAFERVALMQIHLMQLNVMHDTIRSYTKEGKTPFSFIIVKPPEAISVTVLTRGRYVLFDSHKREHTSGAYMVSASNFDTIQNEINRIWPMTDPGGQVPNDYQLEQLNLVDIHVVKPSDRKTALESLPSIDTEPLVLEQQKQKKGTQRLQKGLIGSTRSQYSQGNSSGCIIYATEASLRLLNGETPSVALIDNILLSLEANFEIVQHLEVDEALKQVTRFSQGLDSDFISQTPLDQLGVVLTQVIKDCREKDCFGLILLKPPEALSLTIIHKGSPTFVLFDSHRRPFTQGAYFYVDDSIGGIVRKLQELWPISTLPAQGEKMDVDEAASYMAQLSELNTIEIHRIRLVGDSTTQLPQLSLWRIEKKRMIAVILEQRQEIQRLRKDFTTMKEDVATLKAVNRAEPEKVADPGVTKRILSSAAKLFSGNGEEAQPVAAVGSQEAVTIKCCNCKKTFRRELLFPATECSHRFCTICMRDYLLEKAEHPFVCPKSGCNATIGDALARTVLDEKEYTAKLDHMVTFRCAGCNARVFSRQYAQEWHCSMCGMVTNLPKQTQYYSTAWRPY